MDFILAVIALVMSLGSLLLVASYGVALKETEKIAVLNKVQDDVDLGNEPINPIDVLKFFLVECNHFIATGIKFAFNRQYRLGYIHQELLSWTDDEGSTDDEAS